MAELRSLVATLLLLLVVARDTNIRSTNARELRPSDHGLAYQASPPEGDEPSPEMLTFFGTFSSLPPPSSASATRPPSMALPRALNSSDAALWSQPQDKPSSSSSSRSRSSSDRVMKDGLLIGSLVCGIAGVALLAASAVIFLFFTARKPTSPPPPPPSSASGALHPQQRDHDNAIACIPPATA